MTEARTTKRRAIAARLLACALPTFLCVVGTASAATPDVPVLLATNPPSSAASPASSLTPTIVGEAEPGDIGIVESLPVRVPLLSPRGVTSGVEGGTDSPDFEIEIFDGAGCPGSPVTSGTAGTFEGAGIPLTVAADSVTTFSAKQVDPAHRSDASDCSAPLTYWEGNVAVGGLPGAGGPRGGSGGQASGGGPAGSGAVGPAQPAGGKPQPPQIHTDPGGRANDRTPLVLGSAPGADAVNVYAGDRCGGAPVARGTPAELAAGFKVAVASNAETTFTAVAIAAQASRCSAPVTYTEDSTAPRTRITMGPGVKTRKRRAVFRFKDIRVDPPGTTFACKLDKKKWRRCRSPFRAKHLKKGRHVVKIRATDLAGNVERHPVKRRFRVVRRR